MSRPAGAGRCRTPGRWGRTMALRGAALGSPPALPSRAPSARPRPARAARPVRAMASPSPASPRRARRWTTSSRCAAARCRACGCRPACRPRPERAAPAQRYDVLSAGTGALACTMVFVANGQDPWTALSITAAATVTALVRPPRSWPGFLVEQASRRAAGSGTLAWCLSWHTCGRRAVWKAVQRRCQLMCMLPVPGRASDAAPARAQVANELLFEEEL